MLALCLAALPGAAFAQPPVAPGVPLPPQDDRLAAQALFDDARKLMGEGRFAEACAKFEASQVLDPGIGTQFNLGDCYEQVGRLASAWIQFVDVAAAARATGQETRESVARKRAAAIEPRLLRLRIVVRSQTPGLVIARDGRVVPEAHWGTPVPIDPADYTILATAPGFEPLERRIEARGEGRVIDVSLPHLIEVVPVSPCGPVCRSRRARTVAGWAVGAVGLAGVGVGIGFGVAAIDKKRAAEPFCPPQENGCYDEGLALRNEARDAANISTVAVVVGASAALAGLTLFLTSWPWEPETETAWQLAPVVDGAMGATPGATLVTSW